MNIEVLYEDNHIIAINKRSGDISQGDKTGDIPLGDHVKAYIKKTYNKPGNVFIGVVHRLDRPVSGVMLFAKTSKALSRLTAAFRNNKMQKTYWAIVIRRPKLENGHLTHYLRRSFSNNVTQAFTSPVTNSQKASLRYELIASLGNHHLLQIFPKTGRQHQIRVQLSRIHCPIRGDKKYGALSHNKDRSIHLHARRISFDHPVTNEKITITAPINLKDDVWRMFNEIQEIY
jgi:23S rRNA pseudouridine1911/1915/1917 synthase